MCGFSVSVREPEIVKIQFDESTICLNLRDSFELLVGVVRRVAGLNQNKPIYSFSYQCGGCPEKSDCSPMDQLVVESICDSLIKIIVRVDGVDTCHFVDVLHFVCQLASAIYESLGRPEITSVTELDAPYVCFALMQLLNC